MRKKGEREIGKERGEGREREIEKERVDSEDNGEREKKEEKERDEREEEGKERREREEKGENILRSFIEIKLKERSKEIVLISSRNNDTYLSVVNRFNTWIFFEQNEAYV